MLILNNKVIESPLPISAPVTIFNIQGIVTIWCRTKGWRTLILCRKAFQGKPTNERRENQPPGKKKTLNSVTRSDPNPRQVNISPDSDGLVFSIPA